MKIAFHDPTDTLKVFNLFPIHSNVKNPATVVAVCVIIGESSNDLVKVGAKIITGKNYGNKYIFVDPDYEFKSLEEVELILYHELGHCLLDKEHDDTFVMQTSKYQSSFGDFRYFHLKEFFTATTDNVNSLSLKNRIQETDELVFYTNYFAFDSEVDYQLYYSPTEDEYFRYSNATLVE
ncbi:hypothetical protein [Bacteriovorax sp. Seq25_V]|uniref:hypothetical protein n=1 Tax=Bacteriovorax sp. Seq25_V TaxID=1201288 RepID=UPI00038A3BF8|nr:hypothetical protein [Bacteriovorax sp. Seq25_V]EQC47728.1 hypothetical protein M900_A0256 [Bacteriovorax sp. Seq25_V]